MENIILKNQKINYLSKYFKVVIFFLVSAVFILAYFFLLAPQYRAIKAAASDSERKQVEQRILQDKILAINRKMDSYRNIQAEDINRINSAFPDLPMKDELLSQLESLISQNGLLLTSLMIEGDDEMEKGEKSEKNNEIANKNIGKIKISAVIAGTDYNNLKNILSVFEKNLRIMDVVKVSFSPGSLESSLDIITYYMKK